MVEQDKRKLTIIVEGNEPVIQLKDFMDKLSTSPQILLAPLQRIIEANNSRMHEVIQASLKYINSFSAEAAEVLQFDVNNPPDNYLELSYKQLKQKVIDAKQLDAILKRGNLSQAELLRRLKSHQTPTSRPGNQDKIYYDTAFERIHILRSCSLAQAFELMLQEENIQITDESDRACRWNAFYQALKRRKKR